MAKNQGPNGESKSKVVRALPLACMDETAAVEFLEAQRWGKDPVCPRCTSGAVYKMASKTGERSARFLWRCRGCKKQFTVRVGTVFEDSKIPLRHWCFAFWSACSSKKGVSALQIKRETGLSYESALFLMHRIRYAMSDGAGPLPKLSGTIEIDETYVGGKPRPGSGESRASALGRKIPVVALLQRDGNVRAAPSPRVNQDTLRALIHKNVEKGSRIMTDEHAGYFDIGPRMRGTHETVNHGQGEYARGDISTNRVEGFFSLLKRGIYGTFHTVSKEHLHRYVGEFAFRYNTRKLDDGQRVTLAIRKGVGKRLTYRRLREEAHAERERLTHKPKVKAPVRFRFPRKAYAQARREARDALARADWVRASGPEGPIQALLKLGSAGSEEAFLQAIQALMKRPRT